MFSHSTATSPDPAQIERTHTHTHNSRIHFFSKKRNYSQGYTYRHTHVYVQKLSRPIKQRCRVRQASRSRKQQSPLAGVQRPRTCCTLLLSLSLVVLFSPRERMYKRNLFLLSFPWPANRRLRGERGDFAFSLSLSTLRARTFEGREERSWAE